VANLTKILVVDDTPANVKLLEDLLVHRGHRVFTASSGHEALECLAKEKPDLVLLDIVMPEMSGYEVCRAIRASEDTRLLPVVMVTALDSAEKVRAIEAGADDFIEKPIHRAELLARVDSLLRVKTLHDQVLGQAEELAELNHTLEERVRDQVEELDRLNQLKRFLPPQVADMALTDEGRSLLESHRREISVVFTDLRGFTAFSTSVEPEEVMSTLREFHQEMGRLILQYEGTIERFTGDGILVFFNDPVEIPDAESRAVRMALDMHHNISELRVGWKKRGYDLDLGVGITSGYATIGMIGFDGRSDYSATGSVVNLASRLCDEAPGGHILVSHKFLSTVESLVESETFGELSVKGFSGTVSTHNITRLRDRN
jgi:adenylate cyclase